MDQLELRRVCESWSLVLLAPNGTTFQHYDSETVISAYRARNPEITEREALCEIGHLKYENEEAKILAMWELKSIVRFVYSQPIEQVFARYIKAEFYWDYPPNFIIEYKKVASRKKAVIIIRKDKSFEGYIPVSNEVDGPLFEVWLHQEHIFPCKQIERGPAFEHSISFRF